MYQENDWDVEGRFERAKINAIRKEKEVEKFKELTSKNLPDTYSQLFILLTEHPQGTVGHEFFQSLYDQYMQKGYLTERQIKAIYKWKHPKWDKNQNEKISVNRLMIKDNESSQEAIERYITKFGVKKFPYQGEPKKREYFKPRRKKFRKGLMK